MYSHQFPALWVLVTASYLLAMDYGTPFKKSLYHIAKLIVSLFPNISLSVSRLLVVGIDFKGREILVRLV